MMPSWYIQVCDGPRNELSVEADATRSFSPTDTDQTKVEQSSVKETARGVHSDAHDDAGLDHSKRSGPEASPRCEASSP